VFDFFASDIKGSQDVVVSGQTFEHMEFFWAGLQRMERVLKPGGLLSVTEVIFDPHFQSRNTVQELAGAVGFREKECFGNRLAYTMNLEKPYET